MRSHLFNDPLITRERGRRERGAARASSPTSLVGQDAHHSAKENDRRQNPLGRGRLRLSVRILCYWECQCKRPILSAHNACAHARCPFPLQGGTPLFIGPCRRKCLLDFGLRPRAWTRQLASKSLVLENLPRAVIGVAGSFKTQHWTK
jgi:hypothetical protein